MLTKVRVNFSKLQIITAGCAWHPTQIPGKHSPMLAPILDLVISKVAANVSSQHRSHYKTRSLPKSAVPKNASSRCSLLEGLHAELHSKSHRFAFVFPMLEILNAEITIFASESFGRRHRRRLLGSKFADFQVNESLLESFVSCYVLPCNWCGKFSGWNGLFYEIFDSTSDFLCLKKPLHHNSRHIIVFIIAH